jgi:hypothetical protein
MMQSTFLIHNELMCIVINMNGIREDNNVLSITEKFRHLLQWNPLGFGQQEVGADGAERADDDEHTILLCQIRYEWQVVAKQ